MLEDLNAASKLVLEIAGQEAVALSHDFTGTEHILLGLVLCDDDVAAPLLAKHSIVADEVRARVTRAGGTGSVSPEHPNSLTARAKQVLMLAGREADAMGDDDICPEHLLLGIVRQETGVAALVLRDKGVDLAELRGEILEVHEAMDVAGLPSVALFDGETSSGSGTAEVLAGEAAETDDPASSGPALANPSCPSCGKRLSDVLAVTSLAPVGPSAGRRRAGNVQVIFCGSCGHTLSVAR